MAAVSLLCFDDVYLVAGITSYMLPKATLRMYNSAGPPSSRSTPTMPSAGNSGTASRDKRGQRKPTHVVSAVVVVGASPSDADVAHRRLTNTLAHSKVSNSSKTKAMLCRHGSTTSC